MTTEQQVLIELIKADILGEEPNVSIQDVDWSAVAKESLLQSVTISALESASSIKDKIPTQVYNAWLNKACLVSAKNQIISNSQNMLIGTLSQNKYKYAILKGEASAAYYRKPSHRVLGDVDFLIEPTNCEDIANLIRDKGYKSFLEGNEHHIVFKNENSFLEMHHKPAGIPRGVAGVILSEFLADTLNNTQVKNLGCGDFLAPNDLYHGVILILHTQHHLLYEGIGLRHLCDVAAFVNATMEKPFVVEEFLPLLKKVGLYTFFSVLVDICVNYLGINKPAWHLPIDQEVCTEVLEDILSGGNFGRKDNLRGKSGNLITNHKTDGKKHSKLFNLFRTLKDSTDEVYPIVKQHPILYAVYMPYRAIRYIVLTIKGEKVNIIKTIPLADKRQKIYDKLHIFEVE